MGRSIGQSGLAPLVGQLRRAVPAVRVHLAGHSFGARLVTAAAAAQPAAPVSSLMLLQAAFSQFAFAPQGGYRRVVTEQRVDGPILVTHSCHDHALGQAYPVASHAREQRAAHLGGPDDAFGALGANGAQRLPPGEKVDLVLGDYAGLRANLGARVLNLNADRIIRGHGDVFHPEIVDSLRILCFREDTAPLLRQS